MCSLVFHSGISAFDATWPDPMPEPDLDELDWDGKYGEIMAQPDDDEEDGEDEEVVEEDFFVGVADERR